MINLAAALAPALPVFLVAHVTFVVFWSAALFYLPRLFVHIAEAQALGEAQSLPRLHKMAQGLARRIMTPSMILAWTFGLLAAAASNLWSEPWLHAKLALVLLLTLFHLWLLRARLALRDNRSALSPGVWRLVNEIGPLVVIPILALALLKPF